MKTQTIPRGPWENPELETGKYGIILIGRKGSKKIREFQFGSKANKLLYTSRTFITCIIR